MSGWVNNKRKVNINLLYGTRKAGFCFPGFRISCFECGFIRSWDYNYPWWERNRFVGMIFGYKDLLSYSMFEKGIVLLEWSLDIKICYLTQCLKMAVSGSSCFNNWMAWNLLVQCAIQDLNPFSDVSKHWRHYELLNIAWNKLLATIHSLLLAWCVFSSNCLQSTLSVAASVQSNLRLSPYGRVCCLGGCHCAA